MNNEVRRLRRLRHSALRVRALARVLDSGKRSDAIFHQGALLTWRIARIATGCLRAHPYQGYQRDPSFFERGTDWLAAMLLGTSASLRGQGAKIFLGELRVAVRELDDTRALTLSPDLSDALGRAQASMRTLIEDVQSEARLATGAQAAGHGGADRTNPQLSPSSYLAL